jgi:predicted metal-binding protein
LNGGVAGEGVQKTKMILVKEAINGISDEELLNKWNKYQEKAMDYMFRPKNNVVNDYEENQIVHQSLTKKYGDLTI